MPSVKRSPGLSDLCPHQLLLFCLVAYSMESPRTPQIAPTSALAVFQSVLCVEKLRTSCTTTRLISSCPSKALSIQSLENPWITPISASGISWRSREHVEPPNILNCIPCSFIFSFQGTYYMERAGTPQLAHISGSAILPRHLLREETQEHPGLGLHQLLPLHWDSLTQSAAQLPAYTSYNYSQTVKVTNIHSQL